MVYDRPSRNPRWGIRGLLLSVLTGVLVAVGAVPAYADTDTEPPSVPGPITVAEITTSTVLLTWEPSTDNVGVDRYEVTVTFTDILSVYQTTTNSIRLTGLRPSRLYLFSVRARDAAGNGSPSSETLRLVMPPGDDEPPTTPTGLRVTGVTETTVDLAWNPSTDNVQLALYEVLSITPGEDTVVARVWLLPPWSPRTSVQVSGLTPGTTYTFAVRTRDEAGNYSALSAPVTVTTGAVAACAVDHRVLSQWNTGTQVELTVRNTGPEPIDGWTLSWATPGDSELVAVWGAELVEQLDGVVTVRNPAYDPVILPDETHVIGYLANAPGYAPTGFVLNGVSCLSN